MKRNMLVLVVALTVMASLLLVTVPAFARPQNSPLGFCLRWLGSGGPQSGLEAAAAVLGMSTEDILEAKSQGKTILDLAQAKGLTKDELVARIVEARKAEIQALVNEGKIDQTTADRAMAQISERVSAMVERACDGSCAGLGRRGTVQGTGNRRDCSGRGYVQGTKRGR